MANKSTSGVWVSWPKPSFEYVVKTHKHFKSNYNAAMLYAHYELSATDLKKEVLKYLKTLDTKHPLLDRVKALHENRFTTVGKYTYILNNSGELPEQVQTGLMPAIEKTIKEEEERLARNEKEQAVEVKEEPIARSTVSIQDRIRDRAREVAGEIEGWVDDFHTNKKSTIPGVDMFVALFKASELKSPHVRFILQSFASRAEEINQAIEGKDKDLNVAYSNYSKPELKKLHQLYSNLIQACDMVTAEAKVTRAPKAKKPVSVEKTVAKLKFKKDDNTLGIVSINPSQIVGAKELWVYNTKTRKLTQFKSTDKDGLSVKGSSIINFADTSLEKTVRKPLETLTEFKKAGKVKLRTFLKDFLSTVDTVPQGKLNENHVLLKVEK